MRTLMLCGVVAAFVSSSRAATLRQLGLDEMIRKSTAIVRGRAQLDHVALHGSSIYTHFNIQIVEQWKGAPATQIDIVVPGGSVNGLQESVAGAPALTNGQEYVLFLWRSRTGLTHIMGMSQGVFVSANGLLSRPAGGERMIGAAGSADSPFQISLPDIRARIASVLKASAAQ